MRPPRTLDGEADYAGPGHRHGHGEAAYPGDVESSDGG
jgi:hypothetical protein